MVRTLRVPVFAVLGVCLAPLSSSAGWLCIKNDTKVALVVQEVPDRPGQKRGKLVKLLPGEIYREYLPTAGERRVLIFDARNHVKPLSTAQLIWPARGDTILKFETVEGAVRLVPVTPKLPASPDVVQVGSATSGYPPKR
jgi:hypothetical protein